MQTYTGGSRMLDMGGNEETYRVLFTYGTKGEGGVHQDGECGPVQPGTRRRPRRYAACYGGPCRLLLANGTGCGGRKFQERDRGAMQAYTWRSRISDVQGYEEAYRPLFAYGTGRKGLNRHFRPVKTSARRIRDQNEKGRE